MRSVVQLASTILVAVLLGAILTCPAAGALKDQDSRNLLTNGSFEKGTEAWSFHSHRSSGEVTEDTEVKHGGKPTIRINNPQSDDSLLTQKVTVKPFTRYRLTGWIKTKDVGSMDRNSKDGASLAIRGGFLKTQSISKTSGWKRVTLEFSTKTDTEIEVGPRLGHHGAVVSGTAWFADLSLVELGAARR